MNGIRIIVNFLLIIFGSWFGFDLFQKDEFLLPAFQTLKGGLIVSGIPLKCLGLSVLMFVGFTLSITIGWISGKIPMPDKASIRTDPTYKGELFLKFWYWIALFVLFFGIAIIGSLK